MTQPSGWYDDPQDPTQLRYWDGVVWSSHVSPKVSPTVEKSTIGMPFGVAPASSRPQAPGSGGAQGAPVAPGGYGSPQQGQEQQDTHTRHSPASGQGPALPGAQPGWQSHPATTPDGVQLSGWWLRVGARVLDGIFTFLLALPLTGWFYYKYFEGVLSWSKDLADRASSGSASVVAVPPWDIYQYAVAATFITLLISGAYEVFFLSRSGATPGKKIVGISVRLRNVPGVPPMRAVLVRTVCYFGLQLLSIANLINVLWPLWDDKKQALHDKVASTNVVVGPQPKREA